VCQKSFRLSKQLIKGEIEINATRASFCFTTATAEQSPHRLVGGFSPQDL
jgi:hypothetical protein